MKKLHYAVIAALLGLTLSCKKEEEVGKGFSENIQNLVSKEMIDELRSRGLNLNEGTTPPVIEGIYLSSPHELVSPYGEEDSYEAGYEFEDLKIRFSNQDQQNLSVKVDLKGSTNGTGQGAFLAGSGNKFTLFSEIVSHSEDGDEDPYTATQIRIFSGELTDKGIKNLQTALIMKAKTDPNDVLIPVGSGRIIKDGDGLAAKTNSFRIAAPEFPTPLKGTADIQK